LGFEQPAQGAPLLRLAKSKYYFYMSKMAQGAKKQNPPIREAFVLVQY